MFYGSFMSAVTRIFPAASWSRPTATNWHDDTEHAQHVRVEGLGSAAAKAQRARSATHWNPIASDATTKHAASQHVTCWNSASWFATAW